MLTQDLFNSTIITESLGLKKRVKIIKGPKDVIGKLGYVGEVRHGLHNKSPKIFTVDLDNGGNIQLPGSSLKLVDDEVSVSEAYDDRNSMIDDPEERARIYDLKKLYGLFGGADGVKRARYFDSVGLLKASKKEKDLLYKLTDETGKIKPRIGQSVEVTESYWQDVIRKVEAERKERRGMPFEKNPASHDEQGVYIGDKDLAGNPVPKSKEQEVRDALKNGDDYTAKQLAKMASTPEAKKYLQKIIRQEMYSGQQGVAEGYTVTRGIDKERYQSRSGLEGPFSTRSGKVVYYDKAEGKYYDPDTDMYIEYDDWKAMNDPSVEEEYSQDVLSKMNKINRDYHTKNPHMTSLTGGRQVVSVSNGARATKVKPMNAPEPVTKKSVDPVAKASASFNKWVSQFKEDEGVAEGRFVKGPGGVPLDRQGNPKIEKPKMPKMPIMSQSKPKLDLDKIWFDVTQIISNIFPDGDPADYLPKYCKQHGCTYDDIRAAAKKNGYEDEYAYIDDMKTGDYGYQQDVAEGSMPYPHGKPEAGDKITWYHSNRYPEIEGTVVGWKDGSLIVQSVDPSSRNTEKTVAKYRVPKNNILSVKKQGVAEMDSQGYTGSRDHKRTSKYGSRDDYELGGPETTLGPDSIAKPKDVAKKGADALNRAMSNAHKKKGVAEGLNEFAPGGNFKPPATPKGKGKDPWGDDDRSQIAQAVKGLLASGNKVDWQVPGQMGHVVSVDDRYITLRKWNQPRSKMRFALRITADRDSEYLIVPKGEKHYRVISSGLDEGKQGGGGVKVTFCEGLWNDFGHIYKTFDDANAVAKRKNEADKKINGDNRENHYAVVEQNGKYVVRHGEVNDYTYKKFPNLEAVYQYMSMYHRNHPDHMISIHSVQTASGQGVTEGSLNEFAQGDFNRGDDEFDPGMAKQAQEAGFVKGVSLADGSTLATAFKITGWDQQFGGLYKQYFANGFKEGRMDKIRHDNRQHKLNLKLMKDGSIRHGEQGVVEAQVNDYRKLLYKYSELALQANRNGDDEKCKLYQQKMNAIKDKMAKQAKGVAEGAELKTFRVMYYNPTTDRNHTRDIKSNNESDVWDKFKSKGLDIISITELGLVDKDGDERGFQYRDIDDQGVAEGKSLDPDLYEEIDGRLIARAAKQILPGIRARVTQEGYVELESADGLSLSIGAGIHEGSIGINIGSIPLSNSSSGTHKGAVTAIIKAVYDAIVRKYGTPSSPGSLSVDHDASHGAWQHIAQKLGLEYGANLIKEGVSEVAGDVKRQQGVAEGSYKEGGSITHDGVEYDFDKVLAIAETKPTKQCAVSKLAWVLAYDKSNTTRLKNADISVPIVITKSNNGKLTVIDGLHRLAKAVKNKIETLPVKCITNDELQSAHLKKGVAEGWKEGVGYTALVGLLSFGAINRLSDLVNSEITGEPTNVWTNWNSGVNRRNNVKSSIGQGIESVKSISSDGDKKFEMTLTDGRKVIFTAKDLEKAKRVAAARKASEPVEVKEQGVEEAYHYDRDRNASNWDNIGEEYEGDEDHQEIGFFVAIGDEEDGGFIGMINKEGGKWRETAIAGNTPYAWGGSYMGYLSPNDVMQWINRDYGRSAEVAGPFETEEEAREYAAYNFGLGGNLSEGKKYYTVTGTTDESLTKDFGLTQDQNGWFLLETASSKQKIDAYRAFGSPKIIKEGANFSAYTGSANTLGGDSPVSPIGSIPKKQPSLVKAQHKKTRTK